MENLNVQDLLRIIGSENSLIYIVTDNERSTEGIVAQAAAIVKGAGSLYIWTCTEVSSGRECRLKRR
jgi:hypothetical protein